MELIAMTQQFKLANDMLGHLLMVDLLLIDVFGQIVLDAMHCFPTLLIVGLHLQDVHVVVILLHRLFVIRYLVHALDLQA